MKISLLLIFGYISLFSTNSYERSDKLSLLRLETFRPTTTKIALANWYIYLQITGLIHSFPTRALQLNKV